MKGRITLPNDERRLIHVDPVVHILLKEYAKRNKMSMQQSAYILLGQALAHDLGIEWEPGQPLRIVRMA